MLATSAVMQKGEKIALLVTDAVLGFFLVRKRDLQSVRVRFEA